VGAPKPSISALLVCDMVIEDTVTRKKSIIGTFTDIWAQSFPCVQPRMAVYFCLTDAEGTYDMQLKLLNAETEMLLAHASFSIVIPDRLVIQDFGVALPPVQFPVAGRYELQIVANKEFLGRKDFRVTTVPPPPPV